jgi:hypothetical protein
MHDGRDDYYMKGTARGRSHGPVHWLSNWRLVRLWAWLGLRSPPAQHCPRIPACQNARRKSCESCYAGGQEASSHRLHEMSETATEMYDLPDVVLPFSWRKSPLLIRTATGDESKPRCANCEAKGFSCEYRIDLSFVRSSNPAPPLDGSSGGREAKAYSSIKVGLWLPPPKKHCLNARVVYN